jgi:hypothetical protein
VEHNLRRSNPDWCAKEFSTLCCRKERFSEINLEGARVDIGQQSDISILGFEG